ncbi:MAG: 30S ribosomal protein S13, partial [Deltaproteobacteria bacterium]|nr:30S ribosomal protein S13 [Deltaproteobacteria bacterium]
MARIAGVDLPRRKAVAFALPYIYGIGRATARTICQTANIPESRKVEELTEADVKAIRDIIDSSCKVEGDLRRE